MPGTGRRILIVEDDRPTAEFYRDALEIEGYRVDLCFTADEALAADFGRYDLVILDIDLKAATNGIDILAKIRRKYGSLPVCMVTASRRAEDFDDAMMLEAQGYIAKPFEIDELYAKVEELTERS